MDGQSRKLTECSEPVISSDDDNVFSKQIIRSEVLIAWRTYCKSTVMNPEHDWFLWLRKGVSVDVQIQAILVADNQWWNILDLRADVLVKVGYVLYTCPWFRWLWVLYFFFDKKITIKLNWWSLIILIKMISQLQFETLYLDFNKYSMLK